MRAESIYRELLGVRRPPKRRSNVNAAYDHRSYVGKCRGPLLWTNEWTALFPDIPEKGCANGLLSLLIYKAGVKVQDFRHYRRNKNGTHDLD